MQDILKKVLEGILPDDQEQPVSVTIAPAKQYADYQEISRKNVQQIRRSTPAPGIILIDGGNASLLVMPGKEVHFLRVAAITAIPAQPFASKEKKYIVDIQTKANGQDVIDEVRIHDIDGKTIHMQLDHDDNQQAIDRIRRLLEIRFAAERAEEAEQNMMIVLDGSLACKEDKELEEMKAFLQTCNKGGKLAVGLAKQTSLLCRGTASIYDVLHRIDDHKIALIPVATMQDPSARICMVKLHERSNYWFRLDTQNIPGMDIQRIVGQLATLSNDAAFLGYPYPLIKADMLARVTNEEAASLKSRLQVLAGKQQQMMDRLIKQANVHNVLDTMRF
jgi:hypothetical protein